MTVIISINREMFTLDSGKAISGAQIKALIQAGAAQDLWLENAFGAHGQDDSLIRDDTTVHLMNGMRFYTAPQEINGA